MILQSGSRGSREVPLRFSLRTSEKFEEPFSGLTDFLIQKSKILNRK